MVGIGPSSVVAPSHGSATRPGREASWITARGNQCWGVVAERDQAGHGEPSVAGRHGAAAEQLGVIGEPAEALRDALADSFRPRVEELGLSALRLA